MTLQRRQVGILSSQRGRPSLRSPILFDSGGSSFLVSRRSADHDRHGHAEVPSGGYKPSLCSGPSYAIHTPADPWVAFLLEMALEVPDGIVPGVRVRQRIAASSFDATSQATKAATLVRYARRVEGAKGWRSSQATYPSTIAERSLGAAPVPVPRK